MILADLIKVMDDDVKVAIWLDEIIYGTVGFLLNQGDITPAMMESRVEDVFYSGMYNAIAIAIEF